MTDQSVFDEPQVKPQETPAQQPSQESALADQLKGILNDNGEPKYSTLEEALKGAAHAQTYITELKGKLSEFEGKYTQTQAELDKRESIEQTVARLQANQNQGNQETPAPKGLDEASISELINQQFTQRDQLSKAQTNESSVNTALQQKFGDKANEIVKAKAAELGISIARVKELSQESPQAVLALFGTAQSKQGVTHMTGSQRLPDYHQEDVLEKPKKSLLAGATTKDQSAYMALIRERVYKRNGITQ